MIPMGICWILDWIRMNILILLDDWKLSWMKQTKDVRMYIWRIYSSRYLDTLLYKLEPWMITLENTLVYIHVQWMKRNVRIALRSQLNKRLIIELQCHEKLSLEWTNVWSVIPLFAVLITLGSVNGNHHWLLAHQTAGETIECHSCN